MTPAATALTAAAKRRLDAAGDARAAQLNTPRKPSDPVVRLIKGERDEV